MTASLSSSSASFPPQPAHSSAVTTAATHEPYELPIHSQHVTSAPSASSLLNLTFTMSLPLAPTPSSLLSSPLPHSSSAIDTVDASSSSSSSSSSTTAATLLRCPASSFSSASLSSSSSCLSFSVSTVPRLLHPFFSSSDLLTHSGALFTLSDLLTLSSLNRCIATLARSERIWRPRLQAAIAIRYPAAAHFAQHDERDEHKQQQQQQQQQYEHTEQQEAMVRFTCPYLSAMQHGKLKAGGSSSSLPQLISPNPFVSDLVQQLEASTAKDKHHNVDLTALIKDVAHDKHKHATSAVSSTLHSSVTVVSTLPVPLFYTPPSSSSASALSSKARYIALCQCSMHDIIGCSRLVAPLPPLPAPTSQAHWAHTRVLLYPAPPSLTSCDPLPTLPLCAECRASLAVCMKDYYDYRGEWAGQFTMTPLSIVIVHPPDVPAAVANNERPMAVLDVRYSHIGGYDGVDHRRFEVEYIKAGHSGCTCGCGGMSAGASSIGEWSVRVMHRYRSGIYAMDSPLNVVSNDRLGYSHLRERDRLAQRKRKTTTVAQPTPSIQQTETQA